MHAEMLIMKEPTPCNPLYLKRIVRHSKNKTTKNEKTKKKTGTRFQFASSTISTQAFNIVRELHTNLT